MRDRAATTLARVPLQTVLKLLGRWRGALVLNYHRIGVSRGRLWDHAMWSASEAELDDQLETLARCAEVIGPRDIPAAMNARRGRRVLITFDDGYRDNYELAFPLLRRHGLSATFFLATGFLDGPHVPWWDEIAWMVRHAGAKAQSAEATRSNRRHPAAASQSLAGVAPAAVGENATIVKLIDRYTALPDGEGEPFLEQTAHALGSRRCEASDMEDQWLTWEMAREMHAAGMEIGGHTVTHPVLARLSPERQREEIATCARRLSEELGVAMRLFAYPVGGRDTFTSLTQQVLRDCGVELAFSYYGGFARPSRWDPLDVPRVHVDQRLAPRLLGAAALRALLAFTR